MGREKRRSLWGWTVPARRVLAISLCGGAFVLIRVSPGEPGPRVEPVLIVDVNADPPEVLTALPRLGPALVTRIVRGRQERPFQSLDDFDARVRGIGPVARETLRPFLRFPEPARNPQGIASRFASSP